MQEDVIQKFINQILIEAKIDQMPEDFKKEYTEKLAQEAQRRLGIVAMDELDEQGIRDLEGFMKKKGMPKSQELMEFFSQRIPDFENKVISALRQFADEFIKGAEKLKGTKLGA